jgi:DNA-directed RNA polymerase II subunit RPB3
MNTTAAVAASNETPQPRLEILEVNNERIKFVLSKCHVSIANTLRRVMLSEVPTLAIHMVRVYENTSSLSDEFVSHRLGLIPLVSAREEDYVNTWECNCQPNQQCARCKVYFEINVRNTGQEILEVTSKDIRVIGGGVSEHPDEEDVVPVKMFSPLGEHREVGIPIVKLSRNQHLHVQMEAEKGIGKMHAKWSPVSVASFQYEPVITVREERSKILPENVRRAFVECCPTKVFDIDAKTNAIRVANPMNCTFCGECERFSATSLPIN